MPQWLWTPRLTTSLGDHDPAPSLTATNHFKDCVRLPSLADGAGGASGLAAPTSRAGGISPLGESYRSWVWAARACSPPPADLSTDVVGAWTRTTALGADANSLAAVAVSASLRTTATGITTPVSSLGEAPTAFATSLALAPHSLPTYPQVRWAGRSGGGTPTTELFAVNRNDHHGSRRPH